MRLVNGLGAVALAAAPAASASLTAAGEKAPQRLAGTQCRAGETILYSCRFGRAVGSVCAADGRIHYRYGPRGRPEIEVASEESWRNVHVGHVVGQGGGHQSHVRFSTGDRHYIVYEGKNGALAGAPGTRHSGIYVGAGPDGRRQLAYHYCRRPAVESAWTQALDGHAPPAVRAAGVQPEETGGPFDAWY